MTKKYINVYNQILNDIQNSVFKDGMLPAGTELSHKFSCSLLTVSKALALLERDGYIVKKKGKGTFIKHKMSDSFNKQRYTHLIGTTERMKGCKVESDVLEFSIVLCPKELTSTMQLSEDEYIYKVIRVRIIDGRRAILEYTYMPLLKVPNLTQKHLHSSIYKYLSALGLKLDSAHLFIRTTLPNPLELKNIDFYQEKVLIEVEQVVYSDIGEIIEYSVTRHAHDIYVLETNYINPKYHSN